MRLLLFAFLLAISYAQTVSTSTTVPSTCKFKTGETVQSGWSGTGYGSEHCNHCSCNDGILMCTLMDCPTTTSVASTTTPERSCPLTGGGWVAHGWTGRDNGSNSCNDCVCRLGKMMCTRMACQRDTGSITVVPNASQPSKKVVEVVPNNPPPTPVIEVIPATQPESPVIIPQTIYVDITPPPGDKTICGGKTENKCHGLSPIDCTAESCCHYLGNKCLSITKILPAHAGMECGDFQKTACEKDPACLWNPIEVECDELKEMDCQDLPKEHCWSAQMCSWVLDETRLVCMETKEVETLGLTPIPQHIGISGHPKLRNAAAEQEKHDAGHKQLGIQWEFLAVLSFVGLILGCVLGTLLPRFFCKKRTELMEDLTLGMNHRRI